MMLRFINNIGEDVLVFFSDNLVLNGMLVKKGLCFMVMKSLVFRLLVSFVVMDESINVRLYFNNLGKFKVMLLYL